MEDITYVYDFGNSKVYVEKNVDGCAVRLNGKRICGVAEVQLEPFVCEDGGIYWLYNEEGTLTHQIYEDEIKELRIPRTNENGMPIKENVRNVIESYYV